LKLSELAGVSAAIPLSLLTIDQLKEVQMALARLGYPVGEIDGLIGPRTRTAWSEFKADVFEGNPQMIGPGSVVTLQARLDAIDESQVHDFSTKAGTITAIKSQCIGQGIGLDTQIAYVLATVEWETAKTFKPVREAFWQTEQWRKKNLKYYTFYGRGFVQLTWRYNYERYSGILNVDLIKNPDLALEENIALFVLVHGFTTGAFTGRKISDYINTQQTDFIKARRCINGTDHDNDIAHLALKYLPQPV